jgi:hypothetical protein
MNEIVSLIKSEIDKQDTIHNQLVGRKVIQNKFSRGLLNNLLISDALHLMNKINVKSVKDTIDFINLFNKHDFDYMKCQLENNRVTSWEQILNNDYFKKSDSIENVLEKYKTWTDIIKDKNANEIIKLNNKLIYYSIPLFNKRRNYALIYRETSASGTLFILKRKQDDWIYFGRSLVWIE